MQYVAGTQKVINNLMMAKSKMLKAIADGVEQCAVDVADHAKAGHVGDMAHAKQRYRNRTEILTASIESDLLKVGFDEVIGIVSTDIEYAEYVENIYPYMFPALIANKQIFNRRLTESIRRVSK